MPQYRLALFVLVVASLNLPSIASADQPDFRIDAEAFRCVSENLESYQESFTEAGIIPVGTCPEIPDQDAPRDAPIGDGPRIETAPSDFDRFIYAGPEQLACWFQPREPATFSAANLFFGSCSVEFE